MIIKASDYIIFTPLPRPASLVAVSSLADTPPGIAADAVKPPPQPVAKDTSIHPPSVPSVEQS